MKKLMNCVLDVCDYLRYRRYYKRFVKRYYERQKIANWTDSYSAYKLRNLIESARMEMRNIRRQD